MLAATLFVNINKRCLFRAMMTEVGMSNFGVFSGAVVNILTRTFSCKEKNLALMTPPVAGD